MTTLPAINKIKRSNSASSKTKTNQHNARFMTWREIEAHNQQKIREENPILSRINAATYRNSYKHNLCVSMLKSGFHHSFTELFSLIEKRKNKKLKAGVDSVLWHEVSLDDQEEKLDQLWEYLTKAETAARYGRHEDVFSARTHLAQYFLRTDDTWLSDYFFKSALETSYEIRLDGRRGEAEANCNMGLACERRGDIEEAAEHMGKFYKLSVGRAWVGDSGIPHGLTACRHLSRLCTSLAEQMRDPLLAQPLLHRALNMAKEGEDAVQVANAALRLGRNYEQTKDSETAIQYLAEALDTAQVMREDGLVGQACEGLARSYLTQGNIPRAVEFLDLYAKTSRSNEFSHEFIDACNNLGKIFNSTGFYDEAVERFRAAYVESKSIMQNDSLSKVQLGVASGNRLLNAFKRNMELSKSAIMMSRIGKWKDERLNEFGKPLNQEPPTLKPSPPRTPDPTLPFREIDSIKD